MIASEVREMLSFIDGNLDKDTEEALKGVLSAYTESFVKAH